MKSIKFNFGEIVQIGMFCHAVQHQFASDGNSYTSQTTRDLPKVRGERGCLDGCCVIPPTPYTINP
jgi:hypothetical protein